MSNTDRHVEYRYTCRIQIHLLNRDTLVENKNKIYVLSFGLNSDIAVSRALRGHFLVESALTSIILETLIADKKVVVTPFQPVYEHAIKGRLSNEQFLAFSESNEFRSVLNGLNDEIQNLKGKSRTANLWLQYMEYISILKQYVLAERTSNWYLHIQSMKSMLNLFAASGHIHYARSARIYIQEMEEMKATNPWLEEKFTKGLRITRCDEETRQNILAENHTRK